MAKRKAKKGKRILLAAISLVLVAAIGAGIWYYTLGKPKEPVKVFSFNYLGMTEYWGDNQESYGPVTTDRIQTVFVSDTQTITQIAVEMGSEVKKGDLLLSFDTTLSDLALERKRLEVEKLKLQLMDAEAYLQEIKWMKPMKVPQVTPDDESEEKLGELLTQPCKVSFLTEYDGSTADKALILWLRTDAQVSDETLAEAWAKAVEFQTANRPPEEEPPEGGDIGTPEEGGDAPGEQPEGGADGGSDEGSSSGGSASDPGTDPVPDPGTDPAPGPGDGGGESGGETGGGESGEEEEQPVDVTHFYVVIKVTSSNRELGNKSVWQGLHVFRSGSNFSFQFFNPTVPDHMLTETDETDKPEFDYGSGYTWAQLQQMKADQEKKIADLKLQVRMAEADYKLKELETGDGNVYAKFDGTVVSLLSPEEALATGQPMLKVSGGGGFYVEGTVSELQKDLLLPGQEVTINDWNTGMVYTGTIHSIGDFPSPEGYWNGMGNPNASYYPFTVFVDGSADLQEGQYVSIVYSAGSAQNGIYLENPFLRTEQGRSYVYVRGDDGLLEKRFVTTGKSLWGSYTEILEGLTPEDFLAFPYGKDVKEGMPTEEGDLSDLYN